MGSQLLYYLRCCSWKSVVILRVSALLLIYSKFICVTQLLACMLIYVTSLKSFRNLLLKFIKIKI